MEDDAMRIHVELLRDLDIDSKRAHSIQRVGKNVFEQGRGVLGDAYA